MNFYLTTVLCGACLFVIVLRLSAIDSRFLVHSSPFFILSIASMQELPVILSFLPRYHLTVVIFSIPTLRTSCIVFCWCFSSFLHPLPLASFPIHQFTKPSSCFNLLKAKLLAKRQLCTLNIYRIAIYVIA